LCGEWRQVAAHKAKDFMKRSKQLFFVKRSSST
jgi:hypothetical protein